MASNSGGVSLRPVMMSVCVLVPMRACALSIVDEPISRVRDPDDHHGTAVPGRQPPRLRAEGTGQPSANRAKPDKPDPQRAHRATDRSRTR